MEASVKEQLKTGHVNALACWYGSNRKLRRAVGQQLDGWGFVGVPFAGGMCELPEINAKSILANDKHRHLINLARVVRNQLPQLMSRLDAQIFDPDTLAAAQLICLAHETSASAGLFGAPVESSPDLVERITWAAAYFYVVWCSRNGIAGTPAEFRSKLCFRFDDGGGDPVKRWLSAVASLPKFAEVFKRCAFRCGCGIELIDQIVSGRLKPQSKSRSAIYGDPPFPGAGEKYTHPSSDDFQRRLAVAVNAAPPEKCRVVMRFYDHEWVRELYPEGRWTWLHLDGGKDQHNADKSEVLLINGPIYGEAK